jgi:PAS domain-containing protein
MLEAKVLGQLMLMQSVLNNLPDNKSIFSFVCRGLKDVPGVEKATYSEESLCCENENTVFIPITRGNTNFGEIMIIVSEKESFLEYESYLKNFFFMIEVLLEERRQFEINKLHNLELEQRVEERTKQLTEEIKERKKIAENLFESEKQYKSLSENSKDYIMRFDSNHRHLYINKITYDLLQINPEQLLYKTHRESGLFSTEQCKFWEQNINKVFDTKAIVPNSI